MGRNPAKSSSSKRNLSPKRSTEDQARLLVIATFQDTWIELNKEDNKNLLEVIAIPPTNNRRDANGDVTKSEDIFKYVPSKFEDGSDVPYDLAKMILRDATKEAMAYRINEENIGGGFRYAEFSNTPIDGYRQIVVRWLSKEPKIPDYIKKYPGIVSLALA